MFRPFVMLAVGRSKKSLISFSCLSFSFCAHFCHSTTTYYSLGRAAAAAAKVNHFSRAASILILSPGPARSVLSSSQLIPPEISGAKGKDREKEGKKEKEKRTSKVRKESNEYQARGSRNLDHLLRFDSIRLFSPSKTKVFTSGSKLSMDGWMDEEPLQRRRRGLA